MLRRDLRVPAQPRERAAVIRDGAVRCHVDHAQHVGLLEEPRLDVIDGTHAVHERHLACLFEPDIDDVALGRSDGDVLDPGFAFVAAQVRGHQFHARRTLQRQVEDPRARDVGEEETDHVAAAGARFPSWLAVHEQHVAEASHQRVRRRLEAVDPPGPTSATRRSSSISTSSRLAGAKNVRIARAHEQIPVETEILQHVLAVMRVIPVDAGVAEVHAVLERAAWRHRLLRDVRHAVEAIVQPHAVPVHGGRKIGAVGEAHDDRGTLRRPG